MEEALTLGSKAATACLTNPLTSPSTWHRPRKSGPSGARSVVLPRGTGKSARVSCFAQGANAEAAKAAGAEIVGFEDLADQIKGRHDGLRRGDRHPDASMRIVGQLGQILGPRGLMPNPKVGTVT